MQLFAIIVFAIIVAIFGIIVILDIHKAKKHQQKFHIGRSITAICLILPAFMMIFFFIVLPIVYSLGYGFTKTSFLNPENMTFIGFDNFIRAFQDKKLLIAIKNTAIFVVGVVPLQIIIALLLALFCNLNYKGRTIFKVCFFTPIVISLAVTSFLWLELLSPSENGIINSFLGMFGVPPQDFVNNPDTTMWTLVIISAWQGCGFQMLIFISALSGIRKDLYEAARMDGCNAWKRFLKVTLPGLRPTMVYILITVFVGACRIMIQPMLMVGPRDNALTISYYMYELAYTNDDMGYSSAIALIMTMFIGTITFIQRRLVGGKK